MTNRSVYQELVYRNEVLKTMPSGSTSRSLPSPHSGLAQLFWIRFPYCLGALDRLHYIELFFHQQELRTKMQITTYVDLLSIPT